MPSEAPGFDFGDIVLVPFPSTSQATSKRRLAVIVSSEAYQREWPDVVTMAVTSQLGPDRCLMRCGWTIGDPLAC